MSWLSMLIVPAGWVLGARLGWWGYGKLEEANPRLARIVWWTVALLYGGAAVVIIAAIIYRYVIDA
jgi:hypothetical protein